jgi:hypothetical protein
LTIKDKVDDIFSITGRASLIASTVANSKLSSPRFREKKLIAATKSKFSIGRFSEMIDENDSVQIKETSSNELVDDANDIFRDD